MKTSARKIHKMPAGRREALQEYINSHNQIKEQARAIKARIEATKKDDRKG